MDNKDIIFETDGEENEEELNIDLSKFNQAVIWGTDWTTETMARQLEKGNIDLNPSFQRRDAWSEQEKSRLIESLMLGFPVPPIILAENKQKKNSYLVIDGKQRVYIRVPKKGTKEKLVELAEENAKMVLDKDRERIKREEGRTIGAVHEVEEWLGLSGIRRMEAYDISNISGFESVGSMVVYEKGKPKRSDYRKFKIKWILSQAQNRESTKVRLKSIMPILH